MSGVAAQRRRPPPPRRSASSANALEVVLIACAFTVAVAGWTIVFTINSGLAQSSAAGVTDLAGFAIAVLMVRFLRREPDSLLRVVIGAIVVITLVIMISSSVVAIQTHTRQHSAPTAAYTGTSHRPE